jgi:hypothetical protein
MGAGFYGGFGKTKGSSIKSLKTKETLKIKVTSPNNNISSLSNLYDYNSNNGLFGKRGKNAQIIYSSNQIETSHDFFEKISKGGINSKLTNGKGDRVDFSDGTIITYRVITSTKESPAVDIKVVKRSKGGISSQKIHFIKEK